MKNPNNRPPTDVQDENALPRVTVFADIGHGYAKLICGGRQASFSTLVAGVQPDEADFKTMREGSRLKRFHIEVNGQPYAIAEDALATRRNLTRRLDQAGLGGELHQVILMAGLIRVLPSDADVRLVTQVPIAWANSIADLGKLEGQYVVRFGGQQFIYRLDRHNLVVRPESAGAFFCLCCDAAGGLVQRFEGIKTLSLDCGTRTVNGGVFSGMRFEPRQSFTVSAGMVDVWQHCVNVINREYHRMPALDDIEVALRDHKGLLRFGAHEIDLWQAGYAPHALKRITATIIAEVQNHLEGGSLVNQMVGSGGTWPYIEAAFREHFGEQVIDLNHYVHVRDLVRTPWLWNVTGLERYARFEERLAAQRRNG